ncbi:MAG: hypothetical protein AMXMBFR37_22970 [Steroidobacteraceae bacterium]
MQQRDRPIECHLGLFRAADGKVTDARDVPGMLLNPALQFVRKASGQADDQSGAEKKEGNRSPCEAGRGVAISVVSPHKRERRQPGSCRLTHNA